MCYSCKHGSVKPHFPFSILSKAGAFQPCFRHPTQAVPCSMLELPPMFPRLSGVLLPESEEDTAQG